MSTDETFQSLLNFPIPTIDILDIGAMAEGHDRYHDLVVAGLARVTGFEPQTEERDKLALRGEAYRYLPNFLGAGGPATFRQARYPGCSSLLEPNAALIDLFSTIGCAHPGGNFHVVATHAVETTRLDDLRPGVRADYIKIDIQGGELDVLANATALLADTVVLETEVEFVALYRDQPLFGDIQVFLRGQGMVLHKFIDMGGRPFRPFEPENPFLPMSQVLFADAIFVKDFTRLELYSDDGLLKAAAVLDTVYGSYDLTALLLAEYDRRRGSGLNARYMAALEYRELTLRCLTIKDHS